ncbi:GDP-mannose 4,6-dehydratase [Seleniivibrio sp.]|uniref:GDP-mannose 4,6-dehydratase n=1 Tax=Seleniivibrio sp. TaxID=2898801 RepID=UPI0025E7AEBF|nr:GDP-mannose 4,6-dehydratase [Seleniivibrio sp.]MCD8554288.1 GDP-mannose 4,6-dehydratase [Seleniivibrio sp.]
MNKVMVIGCNSFSGASFTDTCLKEGLQVLGINRSADTNPVFLKYSSNPNLNRFTFRPYDLNKHLNEIIDAAKAERIDTVVNFASQSMVGESWQKPHHWYMTNTLSTINLHERLRHLDFLDRYVHISTPEVYGSCSGDVTENRNYNPSTPYATSRAAADMSLKNFFDTYKFPVLFTRAANVYGEHQQLYRIIPKALLCFFSGKKLPLHGGGHSVRSFIHIDDVSDATLKIAEKGQIGDIYHIATRETISIRALTQKIAAYLGIEYSDAVEITDDRPGKDSAYLLDSTKLRTETGWQDTVGLDEGIARTADWIKANLELLNTLPDYYIHKE